MDRMSASQCSTCTHNSLSHLPVCFVQEQGEQFGDDGFEEAGHKVVWNDGERGKYLRQQDTQLQ